MEKENTAEFTKDRDMISERKENEGIKTEVMEKAIEAWNLIFPAHPRTIDDFKIGKYLTDRFVDSNNRSVDARLMQNYTGPEHFILYANLGDPYALLELKNKLENLGVKISKIKIHSTIPNFEDIENDINNPAQEGKNG